GFNPVNIRLSLDLEGGTDQLTGTLSDGNWTASLAADRAGRPEATNFNGKYTLVVPGSMDPALAPGGDSFGTLTVTKGVVSFSGLLADGTPMIQKVPVSKTGHWPFYVPLYAGTGSVFSALTFGAMAGEDLQGAFSWFKPNLATAKFYTNQFVLSS